MKKIALICLLLVIAVGAFGQWDYYGPLYESLFEGTVYDVQQYGQGWLLAILTTRHDGTFYTASPLGVLWVDRPIVNDGDLIKIKATFNGVWELQGYQVPIFQGKEHKP